MLWKPVEPATPSLFPPSSGSHPLPPIPNGAARQKAQLSSRMTRLFRALTCSCRADPKKMLAGDVTDLSKSLFILQHFLLSILRQESQRSGPHSPALEPWQAEAGAQQQVLTITPSKNTFTKELRLQNVLSENLYHAQGSHTHCPGRGWGPDSSWKP